jgi:hypothetical protein
MKTEGKFIFSPTPFQREEKTGARKLVVRRLSILNLDPITPALSPRFGSAREPNQ